FAFAEARLYLPPADTDAYRPARCRGRRQRVDHVSRVDPFPRFAVDNVEAVASLLGFELRLSGRGSRARVLCRDQIANCRLVDLDLYCDAPWVDEGRGPRPHTRHDVSCPPRVEGFLD